ncbi:MAG: RNB domain-containing ribonuclease [Desulfobacteraceae bacterium]|nr:RNB domain-containing ribonuclease [Desulfobacteraceae bacterium]
MKPGNIIEYIDQQKILSAVILKTEDSRASLLNESNHEVNLSFHRILHAGDHSLDLSLSRDRMLANLLQSVHRQIALSKEIDIQALWEILHESPEWIDVPQVARLCFPENATGVHESAVIRALFENRTYFKFDRTRFFPYSPEQVLDMKSQALETQRANDLIQNGSAWLVAKMSHASPPPDENDAVFTDLLKSFFLFEKESPHFSCCRAMIAGSGIPLPLDIFALLVKLKVFEGNENIDLHQMRIPVLFSKEALGLADEILRQKKGDFENHRIDLTHLDIMTIDGPGTLDFDDALSLHPSGDGFELGIHIADVAHFVKKDDFIDREALLRGSSIYMPDLKIPMLPNAFAEDLCSLKQDAEKPAISMMVKITPTGEIQDYRILPSVIRIKQQLTYENADLLARENPQIMMMIHTAKKFRSRRLSQGAVHISLPEIQFISNEKQGILPVHIDRESPGRMMVAELMIMANWLVAGHLEKNKMPAVFRCQADPKERLFRGHEGSLFQNHMQRRLLNRFVLSEKAERHSGLGLDAYVTATSPIRKYFDLVSQRQIRATLGLETPYSAEDIKHILDVLRPPLANVGKIQTRRNRFWILKHLEKKTGERMEAIVLQKRRNDFQILIKEFMIECHLASSIRLKPEDFIHVKIQHVDARKDMISVFMA